MGRFAVHAEWSIVRGLAFTGNSTIKTEIFLFNIQGGQGPDLPLATRGPKMNLAMSTPALIEVQH
jgi:hypothetical protein